MKKLAPIAIVILILVLGYFVFIRVNNRSERASFGGDTLRIGYIVYPPLLEKNPSTGNFSGISYDIVEAVAKKLNLKTQWTEEVGWGTALEGLNTNRYDVLGTQMWPNEAREKVVMFSVAPMKSVIYPYVRKEDARFNNDLGVLNSEKYTISAVDGELAVFIAQEDYPKAKLLTLPQLSSYAEVFLNVVQSKADVSFAEPSAVEDFQSSHSNSLKKVGTTPVRSFGNSFAFNKNNNEFMKKWNKAVQELIDSGEIQSILEKNKVENFYSIN